MRRHLGLLLATALLVSSASAFASSAISLVTPGTLFSGAGSTLGFEFSTLNKQFITSLGGYDEARMA
ncbi:MAG: hypothetical protein ACRYG4_10490 [Janthinobacterium lividum]